MTRDNGHFWKLSAISEVNNFISRKALIPTKGSVIKAKGKNPVPVKWVLNSREEAGGLISLNNRNVVHGYMQVTGVYFTKSLSPVASDTSTSILIGSTLYS